MFKALIDKVLPKKTNRRLFSSWLLRHHFYGVLAIFRSLYCTKKLTRHYFPTKCLVYPKMKLDLKIGKLVDIQLNGTIRVEPCFVSSGTSYLDIGENAKCVVKNEFNIGQNVQIVVSNNGTLILGGKEKSSGSGITSDSKILVDEYVNIGEDSIIAWDCFITDSDWHDIEHVTKTKPVYIGKHVWISHGVSVLKGARISDNSIVGAKSIVSKVYEQPNVMLVGCPAKIIKENIVWSR